MTTTQALTLVAVASILGNKRAKKALVEAAKAQMAKKVADKTRKNRKWKNLRNVVAMDDSPAKTVRLAYYAAEGIEAQTAIRESDAWCDLPSKTVTTKPKASKAKKASVKAKPSKTVAKKATKVSAITPAALAKQLSTAKDPNAVMTAFIQDLLSAIK